MDAKKLNTQEQEKAKFSFAGATLYGINAVIGSGIFLLPQKIYKGLGPASLAVMLGTALLVILLAVCLAETAGYFNKNGGLTGTRTRDHRLKRAMLYRLSYQPTGK